MWTKLGPMIGVFEGAISDISRVTSDPGNLSDGPIYRVVVTLEQQTIEAGSNNIELQAGMQFNADIVLEKRRAIDWLVDPTEEVKRRELRKTRTNMLKMENY